MRRLLITALTMLVTGCSSASVDAPQQKSDAPPVEQVAEGLTINRTSDGVTGTYAKAGLSLKFESRVVEAGVTDVSVDLNGMVLTAVVNPAGSVANLDGYAGSNGGDTAISETERALLKDFAFDLSAHLNDEYGTPLHILERSASLWSQFPETSNLAMEVVGKTDRSVTSLCPYIYSYVWGTHDCAWGVDYGGNTSRPLQIARRGNWYNPVECQPDGSWSYNIPNNSTWWHATLWGPKYSDACWGHCGAGCPNGNQTITLECLNHDLCTAMHFGIYGDCSDEFNASIWSYYSGLWCQWTFADFAGYAACP